MDAIYATAIYRNGTYQSSPGSGEKHFNSPSWNGWSGSRQNIGVYSDHQTVTTDMSTVVSSGNTADAMVIPQTLVGTEARLRIVYTITYNNVSWENIYTAEFSGNWAAGKHYTYSITINPPNIPIEFTVLEAQWTAWGTSHDYEINLNQ